MKLKKNEKIKNLSVSELYKVIIKKIEEQKFTLITEHKQVILTLFKDNAYNSNSDLQLYLLKICKYNNEYENVLSNVIINLREENKNMKKEIYEIRNILNKICGEKELLNSLSKREPNAEIKLRGKRILNPKDNLPKNQLPNNNGNINFKENPDNNNNNNLDNVNKPINLIHKSQIVVPTKSKSQLSVKNSLTISCLANLEYGLYPPVELSTNSFCKISGYGANSYNGIVRNYNEDKLKVILDYKLQKTVHAANGNIIYPNISFFGMYDGHGGNKCSNFLQEKFDSFLFNSEYFPLYTLQAINEAYTKAENEFRAIAFDAKNGKLLDKSGSCSITVLIIEEWCFISYLGDSRGLYSFDSGNQFYQITRDHKPNDPIEKNRIEKAGGSIYKDDRVKINGHKVHVKEETLAPGVSFPYRVSPGNLAVARTIGDYGSKIPSIGGKNGTIINKPCVNTFKIGDKSDFILLGCDGIFDRLENDEILHKIWKYKKKGEVHNDIRELCGKITDGIIKYSMQKRSVDNVSVIFIAFKNFENKMKDPNFEYTGKAKTQVIKDQIDFSIKKEKKP